MKKVNLILYTPPIGESGYVMEVDWEHPHFRYNPVDPYAELYHFTDEEIERFRKRFMPVPQGNERMDVVTYYV